MLADTIAPHRRIILRLAFVYGHKVPDDRHKKSCNDFVPLDGKF